MDERYLASSVRQYQTILEHAERLDGILNLGGGEARQLHDYSHRLQLLQEEAGLHDQQLLAALQQDPLRWQAHPLFVERLQLLQQILALNSTLLPRLYSLKAVTAAELEQLKQAGTVVSGYGTTLKKDSRASRGIG